MKRIGVLSDTHSYIDLTLRAFFEDCDEIWHAGDIGDMKVMEELEKWKPIKAVHGNIDSGDVKRIYPEYHIIDVEGKRFLLIHIAGRIGKYYKEVCLVNQVFVKNPDFTVEKYIANEAKSLGKIEVVKFTRFEKGEGIEKEEVDFAAEVAAQMGQNK